MVESGEGDCVRETVCARLCRCRELEGDDVAICLAEDLPEVVATHDLFWNISNIEAMSG